MNTKEHLMRELLLRWIRSDQQLHNELKDKHIRVLKDRAVYGWGFTPIEKIRGIPNKKGEVLYEAILNRIENKINKSIADLIRQLKPLRHPRMEFSDELISELNKMFPIHQLKHLM